MKPAWKGLAVMDRQWLARYIRRTAKVADGSGTTLEWITWMQSWGDWFYPVAFAWSFLEGETFVIFGGMAAHLGVLNLWVLIATVWIGSFCGDQVWFYIGRRWGNQALERFPSAKRRSAKVLEWLERYGVWFILSFRFLYGVRNIASVALGTSRLPWTKFLIWNFVAAGIWACSFAGAGYLLGEAAASVGEYGPKILLLTALVIVIVVVIWRSHAWNRRRLENEAAKARATSDLADPPTSVGG